MKGLCVRGCKRIPERLIRVFCGFMRGEKRVNGSGFGEMDIVRKVKRMV